SSCPYGALNPPSQSVSSPWSLTARLVTSGRICRANSGHLTDITHPDFSGRSPKGRGVLCPPTLERKNWIAGPLVLLHTGDTVRGYTMANSHPFRFGVV